MTTHSRRRPRRRTVLRAAALVAASGLAVSGSLLRAEEESAPLSLSVEESVRTALEKNLDLEIERAEPAIAAQQTALARTEFTPQFGVTGGYADNRRYLNNVLELAADGGLVREQIVREDTTVSGRATPGTEYQFSLTMPRLTSDNPLRLFGISYTPSATLQISQPLLRGAGPSVNTVRIRQAQAGEREAAFDVEARMLSVVRDAEIQYWELAYAQKNLALAEGDATIAEDLLGRIERMEEAGLATSLDVLRARTAVETRKAAVAKARADLAASQARLRLSVDPTQPSTRPLVATDGIPEDAAPEDLPARIAAALERRPELKRQAAVVTSLELEEKLARNDRLWQLDAVGGVSYAGLAGRDVNPIVPVPPPGSSQLPGGLDERTTLNDALQDGQASWSVGIRLGIPVGRQASTARYETARQRLGQERLRQQLISSQIRVDVETAFHAAVAGRAILDSARQTLDLTRQELDAQQRNLLAGRTTLRQVLEAQEALSDAQSVEQRALADFASARSRLAAAQGLPLDTWRLEVKP